MISEARYVPGQEVFHRSARNLSYIQLSCALVFGLDFLLEAPYGDERHEFSQLQVAHLLTEFLAVVLLFFGFAIARKTALRLRDERNSEHETLVSLKGQFDRILNRHFDDWCLTPAQRDIALLTIRGLRIAEIAKARGSAEGTIKSHMSAIFRAAGVSTRSELTGMFMDEFLDHGAEAQADPSPNPAPGT